MAAGLFALTVPISAGAQDMDDVHLNVIPRTESEAKRIISVTKPTTDFSAAEKFESNQGGATTTRARKDANAFSQSSENMDFAAELDFKLGNALFRKLWVSSPSSTLASDGLGPLYNARSCQRCHLKDGRGHPPEGPNDSSVSMFLRISIPGTDKDAPAEIAEYLATLPDPVYGGQLQDIAVQGHAAEYRLGIEYTEVEVELSDGETAYLREPTYTAEDLGYGPLHADAMLSPRVAPPMIGLGLLEAIPAADILAGADPDDADGDGISGRAQIVMSREFGVPMLGRFGLKAGMPTVREQSAGAFAGDIGLSTSLFPAGFGDCTDAQSTCRSAPDGNTADHGNLEVSDESLELVSFYSRNLAVPARRDVDDPEVLRGKEMFYEAGCTSCHTPKFVTHRLEDRQEQSFQLIWPYSDLLLHDMGPGLADHRPEARADGYEWRTPPLWGIGLTEQVNGHSYFLHDGRARNLLEAVLWHGGEAQAARDSVVDMLAVDRAALIRFLESL
ncbi:MULTISPECIES: di-heme oxidoredictase family protein [Halocynthiibacter]|uniref:Thiol oxidoreductase n=1 Tax=Halocynthiibacter halioticoli TaxID=2986804 RepID=A0AAE3IYC3_9RHOB|nr:MULTISPECIES: di-heme oxidoredictase family protein [Halocynthiibacter]MCV6824274.1 thiol oxidoreductase [Halocynthiibacter halioticoli]MCW4057275.1 thiol oxidoreductase [Halocynthiibacter sp. SDUM655004]